MLLKMGAVRSFRYLGFDNYLLFIAKPPEISLPFSLLFRPNFGVKYGNFTLPRSSSVAVRSVRRSRVSYRGNKVAAPTISYSMVDADGEYKEMEQSSSIDCQQCSGCSQYHKLVDNLGLDIEYNLQEEIDLDATSLESFSFVGISIFEGKESAVIS